MHFKSNNLTVEAVENRRNIEFSICTLNLCDIENDKQELNNLKQQLDVLTDKLNETKDQLNTIQKIYAGTYMQSLLRDADIERYADEIPSGLDDEIMSL